MRVHINHVLSSSYSALRQIRSIKRSLRMHALNTLITSLVHSRLDDCNAVFVSLPVCDIQHLQSVLNTAVQLVSGSSPSSSSRMRVVNHNWSATKQRLHLQSVAEINRRSVLLGDYLVSGSSLCDHITPLLHDGCRSSGCESLSASSTNCACWSIVACTETHRPTWSTSSSRLLPQP